jgi:SAM-dependent methyltransferase
MAADLEACVASTLEADERLLPLLPELLADLPELGASADDVVDALRSCGIPRGAAVLDLGCGKGAVAVALAERLALRVEGIDAVPAFLAAARRLAAERGVGSRCVFRQGDIRTPPASDRGYDAVLLLSLGPVFGDHRRTVGALRRLARPGGHLVIDDGFLADGVTHLPDYEGYAGHRETVRRLTAFGDRLVREVICSPEATRSVNQRNTARIRRRARLVGAAHPGLADLIDRYVARQERETRILGTDLIGALWVLRRAP